MSRAEKQAAREEMSRENIRRIAENMGDMPIDALAPVATSVTRRGVVSCFFLNVARMNAKIFLRTARKPDELRRAIVESDLDACEKRAVECFTYAWLAHGGLTKENGQEMDIDNLHQMRIKDPAHLCAALDKAEERNGALDAFRK